VISLHVIPFKILASTSEDILLWLNTLPRPVIVIVIELSCSSISLVSGGSAHTKVNIKTLRVFEHPTPEANGADGRLTSTATMLWKPETKASRSWKWFHALKRPWEEKSL
jgi:hypothetical protein